MLRDAKTQVFVDASKADALEDTGHKVDGSRASKSYCFCNLNRVQCIIGGMPLAPYVQPVPQGWHVQGERRDVPLAAKVACCLHLDQMRRGVIPDTLAPSSEIANPLIARVPVSNGLQRSELTYSLSVSVGGWV